MFSRCSLKSRKISFYLLKALITSHFLLKSIHRILTTFYATFFHYSFLCFALLNYFCLWNSVILRFFFQEVISFQSKDISFFFTTKWRKGCNHNCLTSLTNVLSLCLFNNARAVCVQYPLCSCKTAFRLCYTWRDILS